MAKLIVEIGGWSFYLLSTFKLRVHLHRRCEDANTQSEALISVAILASLATSQQKETFLLLQYPQEPR